MNPNSSASAPHEVASLLTDRPANGPTRHHAVSVPNFAHRDWERFADLLPAPEPENFKGVAFHSGFDIHEAIGRPSTLLICLEGAPVGTAVSVEAAVAMINFYHDASAMRFSLNRATAASATAQARENAGPEPVLSNGSRVPNSAWVKWYRAISGCGLREAFDEGSERIKKGLSNSAN